MMIGASCRCAWVASRLLLGALSACSPGDRQGGPPDILFISLDSVRADRLTFRDAAASPNMTALARSGTVFTQAISGSSWTLPAHVEMFTGTPPMLHGVQSDDVRIDPKMPTLPELLRAEGYTTLGFFTARYLWGDYGFARGFQVYRSAMTESDVDREDSGFAPREGADRSQELLESEYVTSPRVAELVRRELAGAPRDEPLFVFAHFFDPHYDYVPPPPWDRRFDPEYSGDIDGRDFFFNQRIYDETKTPPRQIGDRDLQHVQALYQGEIAWTDESVGSLLAAFRELGRLEHTLVVIAADHGEEFFEHGRRGHRQTLFDEVLRVPLCIVPPESQRAGLAPEISGQVSLSDLLPTVLDFAGQTPPRTAAGRSLRPALYGDPLLERPLVSSLYTWNANESGEVRHSLLHSLRTPTSKLLRLVLVGPGGRPRVAEVAHYDLVGDPHELHPSRDPSSPEVQAALNSLEEQLERARELARSLDWSPFLERTTGVSQTFQDSLRALGYAGEDAGAVDFPALALPWGLQPMPRMSPPASRAR